MTSHLESTKNHSKERIKQLQIVLNKMQEESESTTVIFGGDTNLRDSEVNRNKQLCYFEKVFCKIFFGFSVVLVRNDLLRQNRDMPRVFKSGSVTEVEAAAWLC